MVDVSMYYYAFCIYFPVTIWDCMDIVDYAGHVMLIVMFVVVALWSLDV